VARLAHQPLGIERAVAEADLASAEARVEGLGDVAFLVTSRMPRPPPPAIALSAMPDFACF
jgi:hypothetical protein